MKVFVLKLTNPKLEHAPSRYMFKAAGMVCNEIGLDIKVLAGVQLESGKQIRAYGFNGDLEGLPVLHG